MNDNLFSIPELQKITGYTRAYLGRLCQDGTLENAYKKSNVWLVPKSSVIAYLESRKAENITENQKFDQMIKQLKDS